MSYNCFILLLTYRCLALLSSFLVLFCFFFLLLLLLGILSSPLKNARQCQMNQYFNTLNFCWFFFLSFNLSCDYSLQPHTAVNCKLHNIFNSFIICTSPGLHKQFWIQSCLSLKLVANHSQRTQSALLFNPKLWWERWIPIFPKVIVQNWM